MASILKVLFLSLMSFLFTGCRAKKASAPRDLGEWLEQHYPGQYQIVYSWRSDPVGNLSFKVRKSVVATQEQPLAQGVVTWDTRQENLSLVREEFDSLMTTALREYNSAAAMHQLLDEMLPDHSSGRYRGTNYVFVYTTPTPEERNRVRRLVTEALTPESAPFDVCRIAFRDQRDTEFQEIIPPLYWAEPGDARQKHETFTLDLFREGTVWSTASEAWEFNTYSNRFDSLSASAHDGATAWVKAQVSQQAGLLSQSEFEKVSDEPVLFRFRFSYANPIKEGDGETAEGIEPDGFVICTGDPLTGEVRDFVTVSQPVTATRPGED